MALALARNIQPSPLKEESAWKLWPRLSKTPDVPFLLNSQNKGENLQIHFCEVLWNGHTDYTSFRRIWGADISCTEMQLSPLVWVQDGLAWDRELVSNDLPEIPGDGCSPPSSLAKICDTQVVSNMDTGRSFRQKTCQKRTANPEQAQVSHLSPFHAVT